MGYWEDRVIKTYLRNIQLQLLKFTRYYTIGKELNSTVVGEADS